MTEISISKTQNREQETLQKIYHLKVHLEKPIFFFSLSHIQGPRPQDKTMKIFLKNPILKNDYTRVILILI